MLQRERLALDETADSMLPSSNTSKDNPASTYVQIRLFCRKENNEFKQVTNVSYTLSEFKELIQSLKEISNIQQCTIQ